MTFVSIQQIIKTSVPLHYTKKTDRDIARVLSKNFSFLASVPLSVTPFRLIFSPSSSLESQQIFWYRQEISDFLAKNGIKKQIMITYAPEGGENTCISEA